MEPDTIELVFPARLGYVELAESLLRAVLSTLDLDDDTGYDVRMSVHEALINAWRHGAREDPQVSLTLRFRRLPAGVEIEVEDQGVGFDPEAVIDPTLEPARCAPGGRGIFLMRRLMDRVKINSRPGGPTRVFLAKSWPAPAEQPEALSKGGRSSTPKERIDP